MDQPGGARLTVRVYVADDGTTPIRDWLATLEMPIRARIQARVLRFELGNLGDHKSIGTGVWEARCFFGPPIPARLPGGKSTWQDVARTGTSGSPRT